MSPEAPSPETAPERQMPVLLADDSPPSLGQAQAENTASSESSADDADYELPGPAWQGWLVALAPLLVITFGAGREPWSRGLAAMLVALLMLCFPARRRLPFIAGSGLLGLLLAPLLAFLPAEWFGGLPEWRRHLQEDWGIEMSATLTPQAWVTWEAWLFLAVCVAWLAWCLARGFSNDQRRAMIQAFAIGGVILCVLTILENLRWISMPWWPRNQSAWGEAFGPFANRNHTSSLAALTCILCAAAAYDAHRRASRGALLFVLTMAAPLACIFMNTSKAGVLLLFIGLTTWLGTAAMRRGFFQKMAVSASLIFVLASLLATSGGGVSSRVKSGESLAYGTRGMLALETFGMMTEAPWLGVGLGNFEAVFPLVTTHHEPRSRFLHPESDYLLLLAEGGLLTLLPAGLLFLWLFNSTGPWFGKKRKGSSSRLDRRVRNAAAITLGMGALHALVDVPGHGLGYALLMAVLAGIALRPRRLRQPSTLAGRLVLRTSALGIAAVGIAWIGVALGHSTLPGAGAAEALRVRAANLAGTGSNAGALPLLDEALRMAPMNFVLYFERARLRLLNGGSKEEALLDFSRSRMLDPHYAAMSYLEGVIWLDHDPQNAVIGWREFMRRYPAAVPGIYGHFRQMLNHAERHPQLREPLWHLATSAELKLDFLASVRTREEFDRCLRSLLEVRPNLDGLEPSQRKTLFELWSRIGDEKTLIAALQSKPLWLDDGWRLLAEHHARNSDFRSACQVASPYLPSLIRNVPGSSTDIPALERALLYNPADIRAGIDLFQAQKNIREFDAALRTLEKVAQIPGAPSFVQQEIAALHMEKQDYRRAWEHLREAMNAPVSERQE